MQVYGLVLTILFGLVCLPVTFEVLRKRTHPFIVCRNPFFLIVQSLGALLACSTLTLYIALHPDYDCNLYYAGTMFAFAFVAFPMALRIWEYCVQFHLVLLRVKFRSNTELTKGWEKEHWFFRNKWAGSPKFLFKLYVFGFWVWLTPIIPQAIIIGPDGYNENDICTVFDGSIYISLAFVLCYFILVVVMCFLTWGAYDSYRIKAEMKTIVGIWLIVFLVWTPYTSLDFPFQFIMPSAFFITLGMYATFLCTAVWALYLVRREQQIEIGMLSAGYKAFVDELEFLPFRNTFFDFLATQFAQENLLFYEAVTDWKRMMPSNTSRCSTALTIRETFIDDAGLCQVNIDSDVKYAIDTALHENLVDIPSDLFDTALAAVLNNMHTNSYTVFKKQKRSSV